MPRLKSSIARVVLDVRNPFVVIEQPHHKSNLIDGHSDHVHEHLFGDDVVVPIHWRPVQQLLCGGLGSKRYGCSGVHDEVQPQQVQNCQGAHLPNNGAKDIEGKDGDVHCELELQELLNGVEDVPTPFGCHHDGSEVVVQQDDVCCVLGDLSTGDAHSEADVGILKRWGIVGAIACHSYYLSVRKNCDAFVVPQRLAFRFILIEVAPIESLG
mmetsp:Transcript_31736/g.68022  ORF Transcript_31736/g.68022 Transcript_31736/m.68022 type:complete len:212 (+) Transcript_31736:405-1040(+)